MLPLLLQFLLATLSSATCYEPSVAHLPPEYDVHHPLLRSAFEHIKALLTIAVGAPEYASTSFSIEVTSSQRSLWSMHHTARERNASRPDIPSVNGDALYRIASITKSFTVLGILQQHEVGNVSLDDPIDHYIPELRHDQPGNIHWHDITLRSLASQLSGIPREIAQSDLINMPWDSPYSPEELGLPPVSREGLPECDEYSLNHETPCQADDLIRIITAKNALFAPNQRSTYSNVAFELLGLVLQNVTNQTYESYINDAIFKPLGMSKSTFDRPPDSASVIPVKPHFYDVDLGIQKPTGGIYSSSTDLSKFLRYIVGHYDGITKAANWMHPASPSGELHSFYGMPWEIFQTNKALLDSDRTLRFITKGGGLPGYTSLIITIPEYDLGITLLLAGPPDFFSRMREIATVETVRAAEQLAILQLQERYAGSFVSPNPGLNSSMTLVADSRGLVVEEFVSNSTDILTSGFVKTGIPRDREWYMQLVPTLLYQDEESRTGQQWRLQIVAERPRGERTVWDDFCMTDMDQLSYAGLPLNEVVFWKSANGVFNNLGLTGFRANLSRIIKDTEVTIHNSVMEL